MSMVIPYECNHHLKSQLEKLLSPMDRERCLRQAGLQIYAYDLDLFTPKVDRFMPVPSGPLVAIGIKIVHSFSRYRLHKFCNRRTDGQVEHVSLCLYESGLEEG